MAQSKSSGTQNRQSAGDSRGAGKSGNAPGLKKAGKTDASRTKAGSSEGAGGGAKQKQKH